MTPTCRIFKGAYLFFTCLLLAVASCSGDDAPVGQQGRSPARDAPYTGAATVAEVDGIPRAGYFEGTVTGTGVDGTPFTETFRYTYRPEVSVGSDHVNLHRRMNDDDNAPYMNFDARILHKDTAGEMLVPVYLEFEFSKALSATTLFYVYAESYDRNYSSNVTISRYTRNKTTGEMSFDFQYSGSGENDNSTNRLLTITGSFSSGSEPLFAEVATRWKNNR